MFEDRIDAGRQLAGVLSRYHGRRDVAVLGLPRGGVPVAAEVARMLDLDLDVIVVRKLGLPTHPEVAMGAIGEGGVRVVDDALIRRAEVSPAALAAVELREQRELVRRSTRFREGHDPVSIGGRTVIVVDDGVATGSTARAACAVVRARGADVVVLAVPVAPLGWDHTFAGIADEFAAVLTPERLRAVGSHYVDFAQTTDEEVTDCLVAAASRRRILEHHDDVIEDDPS